MKFGVLVFPGSNCDHDCYHAFKHVLGQQTDFVWHKESDVSKYDCLVVPGGFSYGDYLRTGAIARFSPVMDAVRKHADRGKLVLGICNGFQILTESGLLPGALMGWNLRELLAGAALGRERCLDRDFARNPAALLAVTHWLLDTRARRNVHVLFPYSHRLRMLADWQVQLVAESLGKRTAAGAGVGPTPHKALGATDQHSQVQLFAQGPDDKVFDFLRVERHADDVAIPPAPADLAGLDYLEGQTFGQLLDAECRATYLALVEAGRPCSLTTFPEVDARHVGEWLMWQMCATAYGGLLYEVDAFDQPGVEAGKVATYGLMGRKPGVVQAGPAAREPLLSPAGRDTRMLGTAALAALRVVSKVTPCKTAAARILCISATVPAPSGVLIIN